MTLAHTETKGRTRRGFSDDPVFKTRAKVRLLHGVSKMPKHGLGAPGLYCLPDEALTCTSKLRVVSGALYPIFVERGGSDKWVDDHYVLPPEAEKDSTAGGCPTETQSRKRPGSPPFSTGSRPSSIWPRPQ